MLGPDPEVAADVVAGRLGHGDQRPAPGEPPGHPGLHPDEPVPAPLVEGGELARRGQVDPLVHADRVVNARHQRQPEPPHAEHPVAQALVVVYHVEVAGAFGQDSQRPDAEGQRLGKGAAPHHRGLQHVRPVAVLAPARGAERVTVAVQVQAGHLAQHRTRVQIRVRLTGEHLDMVPEPAEFPAQVAHVDALAAAVRLAAIRQERDAQRAVQDNHGAPYHSVALPFLSRPEWTRVTSGLSRPPWEPRLGVRYNSLGYRVRRQERVVTT